MTEGQVKQRCVANLEIIHICRDSHAQLCDLSGVGPIKGKLEQSKAFSPESKTNWGGKGHGESGVFNCPQKTRGFLVFIKSFLTYRKHRIGNIE